LLSTDFTGNYLAQKSWTKLNHYEFIWQHNMTYKQQNKLTHAE